MNFLNLIILSRLQIMKAYSLLAALRISEAWCFIKLVTNKLCLSHFGTIKENKIMHIQNVFIFRVQLSKLCLKNSWY